MAALSPDQLLSDFRQFPEPSDLNMQRIGAIHKGRYVRGAGVLHHHLAYVSTRTSGIALAIVEEAKDLAERWHGNVQPRLFVNIPFTFLYSAPAVLVTMSEARSHGTETAIYPSTVQDYYRALFDLHLPVSHASFIQNAMRVIPNLGDKDNGFALVDSLLKNLPSHLTILGSAPEHEDVIKAIVGLGSERYKTYYSIVYPDVREPGC